MSPKKPLIIANWKLEKPLNQALSWVKDHKKELVILTQKSTLIMCPDLCSIYPLHKNLNDTSIALGAQNCSEHAHGPFTGQISAQSLKDAGARYCLIGHAEVRACGDTDEAIARKAAQLIEQGITPIVCVGENAQERDSGATKSILEKQLAPTLVHYMSTPIPLIIAYEPVWAIGTGKAVSSSELEQALQHIYTTCSHAGMTQKPVILYGGSVNEEVARELLQTTKIDGFLIGRASLDFQKFKKIVLSTLGELSILELNS